MKKLIEYMKKKHNLNLTKDGHLYKVFQNDDDLFKIDFYKKEIEYMGYCEESLPIPFETVFEITAYLLKVAKPENEITNNFVKEVEKIEKNKREKRTEWD